MFETAELGQKVSKKEFKPRAAALRERLLLAQVELRRAQIPLLVVFGGVDGAGKGATANRLNEWMDPRWIATRAYASPSEEERERPRFWRYWRDLPPRGGIGLFLSAWYSRPLVQRVYGEASPAEFTKQLEEIASFEKMLADDGALILKPWMHLGRKAQEQRLKALEADPLQAWRVTAKDWRNWRRYDAFIEAAEQIIMHTSTGRAPWHIVEGADPNYRSLRVGQLLLETIELALRRRAAQAAAPEPGPAPALELAVPAPAESDAGESSPAEPAPAPIRPPTILSTLDLSHSLAKKEANHLLAKHQGQLNLVQRRLQEFGVSTVLVFEGWDAAGKGGAIRRLVNALDARVVRVYPVAAPNDEERARHYLWRFWRRLPRAGRVAIFDRSWYGRVLVERIEGFASLEEWRRAYAEINHFEHQLTQHGTILLKFWLHLSPAEQLARFRAREQVSFKRWKLTDEDWRNRERWPEYEQAVHDMIERTSNRTAPWVLVEAEDKRFARVQVLRSVAERMLQRLEELDPNATLDPEPRPKKNDKGKGKKNGKNGKKG